MTKTKFILDYDKWRCGLNGINCLGNGPTNLQNSSGYMCCLGQWCKQLGVTDDEMGRNGEPWLLKTKVDISLFAIPDIINGGLKNTNLSSDAISINDEYTTTPAIKIIKLTNLLATHNIELEVINMPK
jgi:hypothetical protein